METRSTLQPGERGTKELVERYGDQLVCVRYRYDVQRRRRVKTVELIVDEKPWTPRPTDEVWIQVGVDERGLQQQIRQMGGTWDAGRRRWRLTFSAVQALHLEDRMDP